MTDSDSHGPLQELIINTTSHETRVALLENKIPVEIYIEYVKDRRVVGNIYKGRIVRILPGMQAAFVDIGLEKAAFLYVSDVLQESGQYHELLGIAESADEEEEEVQEEDTSQIEQEMPPQLPIEELLQEGQEILVQVAKEPLGRKGARITQYISLPGRHVVFLPNVNHVGISRRIIEEAERERLKTLLADLNKTSGGFIARTVAEGCGTEEIESEMQLLIRLWEDIVNESSKKHASVLIHSDLDVTFRSIRDLYTPDVRRIVVDSSEEYKKILDFVEKFVPQAKPAVELYSRPEPIFDFFGIELEISKALENKVWLKSGGYIVIEMTEALTAVDVNTGSYVGKRNLEETILKTNIEAAKEIAYQLRLRNIGGIIIVDFIDMEEEDNKRLVFEAFESELKMDRTTTNILEISSLGLVEMTRKRVRENLGRTLSEPCGYCEGKGYIKSKHTVIYEIFQDLHRKQRFISADQILVEAHPDIVSHIYEEERSSLEEIEKAIGKRIILKSKKDYHQEDYKIIGA